MFKRDKILEIVKRNRNTNRGNCSIANEICNLFSIKEDLATHTRNPLVKLLINKDYSKTYTELKFFPYSDFINIKKPETIFILQNYNYIKPLEIGEKQDEKIS